MDLDAFCDELALPEAQLTPYSSSTERPSTPTETASEDDEEIPPALSDPNIRNGRTGHKVTQLRKPRATVAGSPQQPSFPECRRRRSLSDPQILLLD